MSSKYSSFGPVYRIRPSIYTQLFRGRLLKRRCNPTVFTSGFYCRGGSSFLRGAHVRDATIQLKVYRVVLTVLVLRYFMRNRRAAQYDPVIRRNTRVINTSRQHEYTFNTTYAHSTKSAVLVTLPQVNNTSRSRPVLRFGGTSLPLISFFRFQSTSTFAIIARVVITLGAVVCTSIFFASIGFIGPVWLSLLSWVVSYVEATLSSYVDFLTNISLPHAPLDGVAAAALLAPSTMLFLLMLLLLASYQSPICFFAVLLAALVAGVCANSMKSRTCSSSFAQSTACAPGFATFPQFGSFALVGGDIPLVSGAYSVLAKFPPIGAPIYPQTWSSASLWSHAESSKQPVGSFAFFNAVGPFSISNVYALTNSCGSINLTPTMRASLVRGWNLPMNGYLMGVGTTPGLVKCRAHQHITTQHMTGTWPSVNNLYTRTLLASTSSDFYGLPTSYISTPTTQHTLADSVVSPAFSAQWVVLRNWGDL